MRWQAQMLEAVDDGALPGLAAASIPGLQRSVRTPGFAGVTFHEVRCRSALNEVPAASAMPFRWTVNPYRGCSHACVYCFARGTHAYLDLDTGEGFDREVVVKTNVAEVVRREVSRASWQREHVALGTSTDPYQRAEGRYRLVPGVVEALARSGTPFSVLTKGTLLARDLPQLSRAAGHVPVGIGVSLAIWDDELHAALEPGTPSPRARLDLVRTVRDAGLPCGVFVAPVLPWLTDSVEHLDEALARVAQAGATGVTVLPLHLRPGAREWFLAWLESTHPRLVPRYHRLYGRGAYVPAHYRTWLAERLAPLLARHGLDRQSGGAARDGAVDEENAFPDGSLPAPLAAPATETARPAATPVGHQLALL
ncbi:Rv2578c family radical SAM protein [Pseudokineococcus sp. 1T1Z-3]|uniref:Rv2578c family radical SAM protein n=1 Tax=Pseudokineococcus sp. 1T1Z-3 TaxID=3132745 RepID=UPI00309D9B0B